MALTKTMTLYPHERVMLNNLLELFALIILILVAV